MACALAFVGSSVPVSCRQLPKKIRRFRSQGIACSATIANFQGQAVAPPQAGSIARDAGTGPVHIIGLDSSNVLQRFQARRFSGYPVSIVSMKACLLKSVPDQPPTGRLPPPVQQFCLARIMPTGFTLRRQQFMRAHGTSCMQEASVTTAYQTRQRCVLTATRYMD